MEKDMKKIFVHASTGYCGMDLNQVVEVPDEIPDTVLDDWAWQEALRNAESYGLYETNEGSEEDWSIDQMEYYWELYNEEKHYWLCNLQE
jgi:hypothetical protein